MRESEGLPGQGTRRASLWRRGAITAGLAAVLFFAVWAFTAERPGAGPQGTSGAAGSRLAQEEVPLAVRVAPVEMRALPVTYETGGQVVPTRQAMVSFKRGGVVAEVLADVGQRVGEGQLLARLEQGELELALEQHQAALAAAEAQLARLLAGASAEEVRQAEAAAEQARAEQGRAESALRRARELYEAGAIPQDQLEAAETQLALAGLNLEAAEARLENLRRGARAEEIRVAEAQRDQAEVAVRLARQQLADAVLRAPFAGVVASREVEPGQAVGAGSPAFYLVALDEVFVEVGVTERIVTELRPGQPVQVQVEAVARSWEGVVHSVSPVLRTAGRTYPVRVRVANPGNLLRVGMVARVAFALPSLPAAPVVPAEAVVDRVTAPAVFVVAEDGEGVLRASRRRVQPGQKSGGWVQVVGGVEPGERVLVAGQTLVSDGQAVRIVPDPAAPAGDGGAR